MGKVIPIDAKNVPESAAPIIGQVVAAKLRIKGFDYQYPTPPSKSSKSSKRIQVRNIQHLAPPQEVTRYAEAMKRRVEFPPILVTSDGYLVDGNTRVEAAIKASILSLPAVILDLDYESTTDPSIRARVLALGAAFNTSHGNKLARSEIVERIQDLSRSGFDSVQIASLLNQAGHFVDGVLAEKNAREVAEQNGLHVNGSVPSTQWRRLGQQLKKNPMHRAVWTELVRLTMDAGLTSADLGLLIQRIKAAGSDGEEAMMAVLTKERENRSEQITEFARTDKVRSTDPAQLRRHAGFILKHQDRPEGLVEYSPSYADDHRKMVDDTIRVLQRVVELQDAARV